MAHVLPGEAAPAPAPRRVLFVDDDPQVLNAMRNLMRRHRHDWELVFAGGAREALEALQSRGCDVILTDMQMPGIDGAALLAEVKQRFPGTVRIVLTGHAEQAAVLRSLGVAHQFLGKPFTPAALLQLVEHSCVLSSALKNEALRDLIGRLDALPAAPSTYFELTTAIARPDAGAPALSRIIEKDPALCAKVLQVANSAFFGPAQPISTVTKAVAYLGTGVLRGLALCAHVFKSGAGGRSKLLSIERLQDDSTRVARCARAMLAGTPHADAALTAGLVHKIGQIVLAAGLPDYDDVLLTARQSGRPLHEVEHELIGASHAQVGGHLLALWGVPLPIVNAVSFHDAPRAVPHDGLDLVLAVHVSAALVAGTAPDVGLLEALGLSAPWRAWQAAGAP